MKKEIEQLKNWNKDCEICGEHFSENERCICPCHSKTERGFPRPEDHFPYDETKV